MNEEINFIDIANNNKLIDFSEVYIVRANKMYTDDDESAIVISLFNDYEEALDFIREYYSEYNQCRMDLEKMPKRSVLMADIISRDYPLYFYVNNVVYCDSSCDFFNELKSMNPNTYQALRVEIFVETYEVKKKEVN